MFVRRRHSDAVLAHHFRGGGDGFVFGRRENVYEAQMLPNADRAIDLFLACLEHLPPAVDVALDDWRTTTRWSGDDLANIDVRDAVGRIKHALFAAGGVEVSVIGADEQVTLTPNLQVYVFAKTDRWLYLLQGKGLRRVARLRPRSWHLQRGEFAPSEAIRLGLGIVVERLRLAPVVEAVATARGRDDASR